MLSIWKKMRISSLEEVHISDEIRSSWLRSIEYGVSPYLKTNNVTLTPQQLNKRREDNKELLTNAELIITTLYNFVKGTGFVVAVADKEGYLLVVLGDDEGKNFTRRVNFTAGTNWKEEVMGTNAIGLSLYLNKPVQVYGYEHFCICAYNSTCSAAPIHDPEGNIIGVLDLTGSYDKVHMHTLGMVVAGVAAIENQIALNRSYQESKLANLHKTIIMESMSEGVIAIDEFGYITHINQPAICLLNFQHDQVLGKNIVELFGREEGGNHSFINVIRSRKPVTDSIVVISRGKNKIKCNVSCRPLVDNLAKPNKNNNLGKVIMLQENKRIIRSINYITGAQAKKSFSDLVGKSKPFMNAVRLARSVASSDCNILLLGESGTGKDIFAQAIHNASVRAKKTFLAINCGAIPRDLIASELFGYDEGAFTGAKKGGKPGKFELADEGTLFLDEIGEMPFELQTNLLRILEDNKVLRIGGREYISVDVRIIAATNKDLAKEVEKGNFRQDLFYRLNVMSIQLPSLRERKDDIMLLARHFLKIFSERLKKEVDEFDEKVINILLNHKWPGNIRELQNLIERSVNLASGRVITEDLLPCEFHDPNYCQNPIAKKDDSSIKSAEERLIRSYLSKYKNKVFVAQKLGISRSTLYRKMQRYGISITERL
jgi:transcriptional regulator of acetoin/glycerol metabolism